MGGGNGVLGWVGLRDVVVAGCAVGVRLVCLRKKDRHESQQQDQPIKERESEGREASRS